MKTSIFVLLLSAASLCGTQGAEKEANQADANPSPLEAPSDSPTAITTSPDAAKANKEATQTGDKPEMSDAKFVKKAAIGNMTEVEAGKLAAVKGASPAVKNFGKMMVTDHSKAGEKLKAIAAKKEMKLPEELDSEHQRTLDQLSALSGPAFDQMYVKEMVAAHKKTILLFKKEMAATSDPELKAFATATLPTLEMHLKDLTALQKDM